MVIDTSVQKNRKLWSFPFSHLGKGLLARGSVPSRGPPAALEQPSSQDEIEEFYTWP